MVVRPRLGIVAGLLAGLGATGFPAVAESAVVGAGSATSYLVNTSDPGIDSEWFLPGFVEGPVWSGGTYGIGYDTAPSGSGAQGLIRTFIAPPAASVYTRTTFSLADASQVFSVFLGQDYDDGVVAWLNGVEVYRSPEMRYKPLVWNAAADPHESSNGWEPDYEPLRDISDLALPALNSGANVLAIGVWNDPAGWDDLVLVPQLVIDRMLTRGPYLQQLTSDGVILRWRTALPVASRVLFGPDPDSLPSEASVAGPTTEHEVALSGLAPLTRYYYAIGTADETLAGGDFAHFFQTGPPAGTPKPTRAWVLGDSGKGTTEAVAVREAYYGFAAASGVETDLILMLGDNAYPLGKQVEYQQNLFDIYAAPMRNTPLWPTIGNHDLFDETARAWPYFDIFSLPREAEAGGVASSTEAYYSFDYANVHFVVLDSMNGAGPNSGPAMLSWLEADLADVTADWIVAFWHHPPYSKGSHDSDDPVDSGGRLIWMRENVVPLLEDYGVDLVLNGHSHSYERSFLIDGHYGDSTSFVEGMKTDPGDGNANGGDGAYVKPYRGTVPYGEGQGAVYTVAGNASSLSPGKAEDLGGSEPNHPAMVVTSLMLGSLVLDVDGNRLDLTFLDASGAIGDEFTIFKGGPTVPPEAGFSARPRAAAAPATVTFSDLSLHGPTTWNWDFDNDGLVDSSAPQASFEFDTAGLHAVSLSVSNSAGWDEEFKPGYICVTSGFPGAVDGLTFSAEPEFFFWSPADDAMAYDVVRGDLAGLARGDRSAFICLEDDDSDLEAQDVTQPTAGQALFYLVGAVNCAGEQGTLDAAGPGAFVSREALLDVCASCATGADDDADLICSAADNCPSASNPDQDDSDADGAGDACDGCPADPAKVAPGFCGCGVSDIDSDGDATPDCGDLCPADLGKILPGVCGCGVSDLDTDNDLTPDCIDGCPNDPFKVDPGFCGCGAIEIDSDQDGTPNCIDGCPYDSAKTAPGVCGCGVSDKDSDLDGIADCHDGCPADDSKVAPGFCGCGVDECWIVVASGVDRDLASVSFPRGGLTGYVAGEAGTVLKTIDGGFAWQALPTGTTVDLAAVDFPSNVSIGYAVGALGRILRTSDGGQHWAQLVSGTIANLRGVSFVPGTSTGYVVGSGGTILKTVNGGNAWTGQVSGTLASLMSVHFPGGATIGYAVGATGTILKTVDGGQTWVQQSSPTTQQLEAVLFPEDPLTGYIVGAAGTLLKTTNGGASWFFQNPVTPKALSGISFPENAVVGYVVGSGGVIRKTTNGGQSWVQDGPVSSNKYRDVEVPASGSTGYIVGEEGIILKRIVE